MSKYSICITHYNNLSTIEESLMSIFRQIDDDFEIIVVDGKSKDGSVEILRKYQKEGRIKLIERKCSRGLGRQIALENSSGDYVISGLDMDDIFTPAISSMLESYHHLAEGKLLSVVDGGGTMVGSRQLLTALGGWRNLQFRENWELSRRAAVSDRYRWTIFPIILSMTSKERSTVRSSGKYRYVRYRENIRVGHKQFDPGEKKGVIQRVTWTAASLGAYYRGKYRADQHFTSVDPKDFVDSRDYWPPQGNRERELGLYRTLLKRDA